MTLLGLRRRGVFSSRLVVSTRRGGCRLSEEGGVQTDDGL